MAKKNFDINVGTKTKKVPDVSAALKILQKKKEEELVSASKKVEVTESPKATVEAAPQKATKEVSKTETKVEKMVEKKADKKPFAPKRGTMPPPSKKRATFNIDNDLHRAIKDYCYFQEIGMVDYIFDLVKSDLKKKGKYPPRQRK